MGKDAVASEIVDGATGVADLADLADFDEHVASKLELCAQGEREQVDAPGCEVFSKVTLVNVEPACLRRLDGLRG